MGCHDSNAGSAPGNPPDDLLATLSGLINLRLRVRADEDTGCVEARCSCIRLPLGDHWWNQRKGRPEDRPSSQNVVILSREHHRLVPALPVTVTADFRDYASLAFGSTGIKKLSELVAWDRVHEHSRPVYARPRAGGRPGAGHAPNRSRRAAGGLGGVGMTEPHISSPLPGTGAIDEAIEAHLAQWDSVSPEVRKTAWVIAALVQRLTPSAVLSVLRYAHLMARGERG
jgi:hypothetical protein